MINNRGMNFLQRHELVPAPPFKIEAPEASKVRVMDTPQQIRNSRNVTFARDSISPSEDLLKPKAQEYISPRTGYSLDNGNIKEHDRKYNNFHGRDVNAPFDYSGARITPTIDSQTGKKRGYENRNE